MGPAFLLPNGNAIFFGGNGHTAIYDPTTNLWSAGPNQPTQPFSSTISGATNVSGTIAGVSNTSPMVVTTSSTAGMNNNDVVTIAGVTGNTAANGNWIITVLSPTTFQLAPTSQANANGNGAYTGGGTWFDAITITAVSTTGLNNGQLVTIAGVGGNTAANGSWTIANLTANSFQIIGPQGNGTYTSGGTWSTSQLSMDDAPGCMMANGDILLCLSPLGGIGAGGGYTFPNPSFIYEFDPTTGIYTNVTPAGGISDDSDFLFMIALPSGQVLLDNEAGPGGIQIYTPAGLPNNAWRPVITNINYDSGTTYTLTGTQLNGISEGGSFGDEATMATNYPIVQLTDGSGNVTYATTSNWSSVGLDTGPAQESVQFTLPTGKTLADYASVIVTANGIPSIPSNPPLMLNNTDENVTIQVDPNDSTMVQVLVTGTNTVVATYSNSSSGPIIVAGDANNNTVTVNEAYGVVNVPISFDGGVSPGTPGDQMIVIGTSGNDSLDLAPTSPTTANMTFDGSPVYSFLNIQQFAFDGMAGNDSMTVDSSTSLTTVPIQYDGGTGFNTLALTQNGGTTETSDTYSVGPNAGEGSDVINGPSGTQTVYFQNLSPTFDNVPATTETVFATNASNAINYSEGYDTVADFLSNTPNVVWGQVSVDNQEPLEFTNKDNLVINGQAGSDVINLNNPNLPAGSNTTTTPGLSSITVYGDEPPTFGATSAGDTLIANGTTAADTIKFAPTSAYNGTITGAGPVPITFNAIEQTVIDGQGGGDALTVTTPAGLQIVTVTPGALADEGQVTLRDTTGLSNGDPVAGLSFNNLGATGSLTIADASRTRVDALTIDGTDASNRFDVAATGDVGLNTFAAGGTDVSLVTVHTPGVMQLTLEGYADNNVFNVAGSIPFTGGLFLDGGGSSDGDTLNLTAATGAVAVSLANDTVANSLTTITGYGATVTLDAIELVNLALAGNTLAVAANSPDDTTTYTPTGTTSGSFQDAVQDTVFNFTAATGTAAGFTINGATDISNTVVLAGVNGRDNFILDATLRTASVTPVARSGNR